jgi:hypothetical protein
MTALPPRRGPLPPHLVLAVALVLPGMGQVLNRQPVRGLIFAFFALLLGAFTLVTAPPEASWIGRLAGGIFVHLMAVLDAYRVARLRAEAVRAGDRR